MKKPSNPELLSVAVKGCLERGATETEVRKWVEQALNEARRLG